MKKKILSICLITLLLISAICICAACDNKSDNDIGKLQMNKKYIAKSTINSELTEQDILDRSSEYLTYEHYYIFYSDGTGICVYNDIDFHYNIRVHRKYTLHFKYTYVDNDKSAVVCFYDSVDDTSTVVSTNEPHAYPLKNWTTLLTVSQNVICTAGTSGYSYFVNEDYAKQLTHFNEKEKQVEEQV